MGFTGGSVQFHKGAYYVQLYWNRVSEKFWSVLIQGVWYPIKNRENAERLLQAIREEIDRDREGFDPRAFRPGNPLCIGEYYKTWLSQIDVVKGTKRDYKTAIVKYAIPFFTADKDIRKFRKAELLAFQKSLPLSDKGKFNVMGALKTMLRWAYSNEEIIKVAPFPKIGMGESPAIEYLTLDQQEKILANIPEEHQGIFRFAMEYGLRIGEVCAVKRDSLRDGKVYIHRAFSGNVLRERTKTGDIRQPAITPYAEKIIAAQRHLGAFLFEYEGKPYNNEILNRIWHKAEKAAGIRIKLYNAVRHSLGCQLLDEGHDLSLVQEILGHRKSDMTRRYAKRTAKKIGQVLSMRRSGTIPVEQNQVVTK